MLKKFRFIICIFIISSLLVTICYAEDLKDINTFSHIYKNYDNNTLSLLNNDSLFYDEIEDLIHVNNATVKSNWNLFEANKTSSDIYDSYIDAADSLDELASSATSDVQAAMYQAQAEAMRMNADSNLEDSNTNFLNYYIVEKNLVMSTKVLYINYLKSVLDEVIAGIDKEEAQRKVSTAENNEKYGNGTRIETLTAKKNEADANASYMNAASSKRTNMRNLLINLGFDPTKDYYINELSNINVNIIDTINFEEDYKKALENNYQYEIFRRRYNNANTEEYKKQYEVQKNSAPSFIRSDLEKKYADIQDMKSTYLNMKISHELYEDELKKAKIEYDAGNISEKQYKTAVSNERKGDYELKNSMYDIMSAYEIYISSVNGLASASAG